MSLLDDIRGYKEGFKKAEVCEFGKYKRGETGYVEGMEWIKITPELRDEVVKLLARCEEFVKNA